MSGRPPAGALRRQPAPAHLPAPAAFPRPPCARRLTDALRSSLAAARAELRGSQDQMAALVDTKARLQRRVNALTLLLCDKASESADLDAGLRSANAELDAKVCL